MDYQWSLQGWFLLTCGKELDLGSTCTQRSLIDILNLFFLIIYGLGLLMSSLRRKYRNMSRSRHWEIMVVSVCCTAAGIAHFSAGIWVLCIAKYRSWEWVVCFVRGLNWIALTISLNTQPTKWVAFITVLWWTSFSILISAYNLEILVTTHSLPVLDMISWPISLLLLLFCFKLITRNNHHQDSLENSLSQPLLIEESVESTNSSEISLSSRLTFSWLNPLLRLGYCKTLDLSDIPCLDSEDGALQAYQTFLKAWENERKDRANSSNLVSIALAKCYLKKILLTGFCAFFKIVSAAALPILLYAFVWYSNRLERDLSVGFLLISCLVVTKTVESLSQRHCFFGSRRLGMRMRSALMAAIFQKQLKLSSQGRRKHSSGEILNYIAVDAYRIGEFPGWLHMSWSLSLQLLISVVILFGTVGTGALPGVVPLTICGILNIPFGKILHDCQSKFMVAQDERLRATSEVLNNMKIIKLQSWEENFRKMIESLRDLEFKWLTETQIKKSYEAALFWMSPTVVSAVVFAGTAAMGTAPLNATTLFTVLATLRIMSEPVRVLPEAFSVVIQAKVSLDRIGVFLLEDELKEEDVKRLPAENSDLSIKVHGGVFSWDTNLAILTLKNINLSINKGQKVAICGPVGAGKSSLLYAMLGEIDRISGSVEVFGSVAFVSQQSWIQSGTIRDNILYGKPMNKTRYGNAIRCCALDKDIENFAHGDLTEIGERGLNMSGGQKQRIQLARAVYSDADIYLLDDPFSAVDAHTAAILFHDCVMAAMGKKTVILVTHQVEFLIETDQILVMENGQITQAGIYEELLKSGTAFEQLVNAHQSSMTILDSGNHENGARPQFTSAGHIESNDLQPVNQNSAGEISVKGLPGIQLTEEEEKEIGDLGWRPYKDYLQVSGGTSLLALATFAQTAFVFLQSLATCWLAVAVQMHDIGSVMLVGIYAVVSIISCIFVHMRSWIVAHLGLRASNAFFSGLMDSVFKAPMLFFDSTPVGRILTRVTLFLISCMASSDMSILDFDLPFAFCFTMAAAIEVATTITIMVTVTWQVLVVVIPVLIITVYLQRYHLATARELVRINGTTKAPVINHAAESLLGAVTIRAFGTAEMFIQTNLKLIDTDAALFFHTVAALEWLLLRVQMLQNLTILTSTLFLVLLPQGTIASGFLGLCLSYALTLSSTQAVLTKWYCYLENYIISVERIKQFMHIPPEPPQIIGENRPPHSWPHEGKIELQDLKIRYRPTTPLVLKGISCTFIAGSKVGVVGRTGSGKSTLIGALFRLVDPAGGRILVDNLDICSIGLKDLRMRLSIIPQEPTLFRGTVRSNLDPLGLHCDHEIWEALEKCQLKTTISSLPALLDSSVSDDGENWSVGQRQLFCLGRALLRKNRILVLDEATASIDSATDAVLQRVIRKEFFSCTVITIAHRVPTVTDSDMVMVLSYGKLVEYEKPSKLMETNNSAFSKLVAEYWSNCKRNCAQNQANR